MKTLVSLIIFLMFLAYLMINKAALIKAKEQNLKYQINCPLTLNIPDFTKEYKIDSLGCIHFINQDSVPTIICGTYFIQPFTPIE